MKVIGKMKRISITIESSCPYCETLSTFTFDVKPIKFTGLCRNKECGRSYTVLVEDFNA